MKLGSARSCLRKGQRSPKHQKVRWSGVDAYEDVLHSCAAGPPKTAPIHSFTLDPDCSFPFHAWIDATWLAGMRMLDEHHDYLKSMTDLVATMWPKTDSHWQFQSSLDESSCWTLRDRARLANEPPYIAQIHKFFQDQSVVMKYSKGPRLVVCTWFHDPTCRTARVARQVELDQWFESWHPKILKTWSDAYDAEDEITCAVFWPQSAAHSMEQPRIHVSLTKMSRQGCSHATPQQHRNEGDPEEDPWLTPVDVNVNAGHIGQNPTIPIHLQADWIQRLAALWTEIAEDGNEGFGPMIHVRSWYLNPQRYMVWTTPRSLRLDQMTDFWLSDIRTIWGDILDDHLPVFFNLVHPDPARDLRDLRFAADLIISQNWEWTWMPTLFNIKFHGWHTRVHTVAQVAPRLMSKWEAIYLQNVDRHCGGPAWNVDFHRLCEVSVGYRRLNAAPFHLEPGHCVDIDIHPPTPIVTEDAEDSDENAFMGRNPILVRPRDDEVALAPDPHDHSSADEDVSREWSTIILFTIDREAVIGRVTCGSMDHFYSQAAAMIGVSDFRVIGLHEVTVPPQDLLAVYDSVWIVQKWDDIPQGSHLRMVLVDVEFCDHLPHLDTEVVRQTKLIVSTMTRTWLLSLLGLQPYCSRVPCLVKINGNFAPERAPFHLKHGDFLHVIVSPGDVCLPVSTRLAALAALRDIPNADLAKIAENLPDHMHWDQMPNSDRILNRLEFEMDNHAIDLLQREIHVHSEGPSKLATIECRLDDDIQPLRNQMQGIIEQNERQGHFRQEDELIQALEQERAAIRDLHGLWSRVAAVWFNGRRWAKVKVWYISYITTRICEAAREVWLDDQVHTWYDAIINTWIDQVDPEATIDLLLVTPQPEGMEDDEAAHLIISQHSDFPDEGAALISLTDDGYRNGVVERQALVLPIHVTHELLLTIANRLSFCIAWHQIAHCATWFRVFELTHEGMVGRPGLGYHVKVQRFAAHDTFVVPPGPTLFPVSIPTNAPPITHALHAAIVARHAALPGEPINLRITTWMLNHHSCQRCLYGRDVDLPPNPQVWFPFILLHWQDMHQPHLPTEAFLVSPNPQTSLWLPGDTFHVVMHQQPLPDQISALVTVFDQSGLVQTTRAAMMPRSLRQDDVLHATDLVDWCPPESTDRYCEISIGAQQISAVDRHRGEHGNSFRVILTLQTPAHWPVLQETDETGMLQLGTNLVPPEDRKLQSALRTSLQPACRCAEWFDAHFTLPCFDVEASSSSDTAWMPMSLEWLRLPWFAFDDICSDVWVYYDGSYQPDLPSMGYAAAAFVRTQKGWEFAGAISGKCTQGTLGSYQAELRASVLACKFLHDLLKIICANQLQPPAAKLLFDSQTVGMQTQGLWQAKCDPEMGHSVRALVRICEARFSIDVQHEYVPGHVGNPGNEIVDVLAKDAALKEPLQDWSNFLDHTSNKAFSKAMEWVWLLFHPDWQPLLDGHDLVLPSRPTTTPTTAALALPQTHRRHMPAQERHIRLASCNVLTLKGKIDDQSDDVIGPVGPSRLATVLGQFAQQEVSVFAMQETRCKRANRLYREHFHLIHSPATARGHFGILVGLSKAAFSESAFTVIALEPRLVLMKVQDRALKFILIAAHAPHSGQTEDELAGYWQRIDRLIPNAYQTWPKVLCADANCKLGDCFDQCIGGHDAESMTVKSQPFIDFVHNQDIFLPATFEAMHSGSSGTWCHTSGSWSRLDYIGLPNQWHLLSCSSWVSEEIDVSLTREDHRAVLVDCALMLPEVTTQNTRSERKIKVDQTLLANLACCRQRQWIQPELDVHTHAQQLQTFLLQQVGTELHSSKRPLKTTMSDYTWELVCAKRDWRNQLAHLSKFQGNFLLIMCFQGWRQASFSPLDLDLVADSDRMLARADVDLAVALHQFRLFGARVLSATRADDLAFYQHIAAECADWLHPSDVKEFWQVIRRSLPKFRQRRQGVQPQQLELLKDQWQPYFQQLEAGYSTTPVDLVADCHAFQCSSEPLPVPAVTDLPSIVDLEDELRATNMRKATGFDPLPSDLFHLAPVCTADCFFPLLLKIYLWQSEPIVSKGGPLALLPKRLQPTEAAHFRGIMLLPTFGKRLHALLRKDLISRMHSFRLPGQLGGFPGQMVSFGSQALRTYARVMDSYHLSSGVVFIDLANAFHRLLREFVSGTAIPADAEAIVTALAKVGFSRDALQTQLQREPLLSAVGCPPHVSKLLQDVHTFTWFTIGHSHEPSVTRRGTRPGSPLADIIFHILMADIMGDFRTWMQTQEDYQRLLQLTQLDGEPIIWSDDVAIPWATSTASELPAALQMVVRKMHSLFADRGFSMNFAKGKTSIVATFRGPDASKMRHKYQLGMPAGDALVLDNASYPLHYVPTYKHLGTLFASSHQMDKEIEMRIAMAAQAFNELAKPVLCNRHLPPTVRMRLYQSLVGSRLFFGLGAWPTPTLRQLARLKGVLLRFVRRVLRVPLDASVAQAALQHLGSTLCLDPRARLALDRLLYVQKLWAVGPAFLQHQVMREADQVEGSWIAGVRADLHFLQALEPEGCAAIPSFSTDNLTGLIDFWQQNDPAWRRLVKRAWRRFGLQETLIQEAKHFHSTFTKI